MDQTEAHLLLQTRVRTLTQELGMVFQRWYLDLQLKEEPLAARPPAFWLLRTFHMSVERLERCSVSVWMGLRNRSIGRALAHELASIQAQRAHLGGVAPGAGSDREMLKLKTGRPARRLYS
jgi:hypothetical protein